MKNFKIWVVDDNPDDIERINRILKFSKHIAADMDVFEDAHELYTHLERTNERPNLMLLDYDMPGDNGDDVLKKLQELGDTSFPVVMMTGRLVDTTHIECYGHGAKGFMFKSFDYDMFKKDVQSLFNFWASTLDAQ